MMHRVETSLVTDGNMSPRWSNAEEASAHRRAFMSRIGANPARLVLCRVPDPNGSAIREVAAADAGDVVADALITQDASAILGLLTADCLPVVIQHSGSGWRAIAHCGWKSTDLRLPEKLVRAFIAKGCPASGLSVSIGPSIHAISYLRPRDAVSQTGDERWTPYLSTRGDRIGIDLHGYVRAQCLEAGVSGEKITMHPSDTYADHVYFSHRRSQETGEAEGRMMTVIL